MFDGVEISELRAGDRDNAGKFLLHLADRAKAPVDFAMLASLAETSGRIELAIAVARRSIEAGVPLMVHGYPVTSLPSGGSAEPSLLFAIVRQESAFSPVATSRVGARGLMQLMPKTAKSLKVNNAFDPQQNVDAGVRHLKTLLNNFGGDIALSLAAYNAGEMAVQHHKGVPPYAETRDYVKRITALYAKQNSILGRPGHPIRTVRDNSGHVVFTDLD